MAGSVAHMVEQITFLVLHDWGPGPDWWVGKVRHRRLHSNWTALAAKAERPSTSEGLRPSTSEGPTPATLSLLVYPEHSKKRILSKYLGKVRLSSERLDRFDGNFLTPLLLVRST